MQLDKMPLIVSMEGNIGLGKSTILSSLKKMVETNKEIIILQEPVHEWTSICDEKGQSCLTSFYQDPIKFSFSFQILVLETMKHLLVTTIKENPDCKIIICERSIASTYHVFTKMLYHSSCMNEIEFKIFECIYAKYSEYIPKKIIYLQCSPEICYSHIKKRSRKGEGTIDLDYLIQCDKYHDLWIQGIVSQVLPILTLEMVNFLHTNSNVPLYTDEIIQKILTFIGKSGDETTSFDF